MLSGPRPGLNVSPSSQSIQQQSQNYYQTSPISTYHAGNMQQMYPNQGSSSSNISTVQYSQPRMSYLNQTSSNIGSSTQYPNVQSYQNTLPCSYPSVNQISSPPPPTNNAQQTHQSQRIDSDMVPNVVCY